MRTTIMPSDRSQTVSTSISPIVPDGTPTRLSRRTFLRLGLTLVAGVSASACSTAWNPLVAPLEERNGTTFAPPDREEIQLVYQDWPADWFPELVEAMLAQFHEEHPGIRVFFTPAPDNLAETMLADMQMGTAPDVLWGSSTLFPSWAQQGYMVDLQPYVTRDLDRVTLAEWDPIQYAAFFLEDGRQFGLPKYHGVVGLYYNKDLFDAAGLAYPTAAWTHEEYHAAMLALSDTDSSERARWGSMLDVAWDRLQIHANAWGGHLVAPYNAARCIADRPAAAAGFEWLRARIWDDHVMASFADVQYMSPRSAFINQRVGMIEEGSWLLKDILGNSDFRVGVAMLPRGPRQRVNLTTTDGYGIYTGSQYTDAAWQLVDFLAGPTYGLAMAEANLLQPARASLIPEWVAFVETAFPEQAPELDLTAFTDSHHDGSSTTTEIAENMAEVQPRLTAVFEAIFTRGQAPVSELQAVCAQINQLQEEEMILYPRLAR